MKYRYRFKNPRIEKAVFALFDENSIKAAIDRQMDNVSNIISLANCWPKENKTKIHEELQENIGLIGRIDFAKSELEAIHTYDPKGWNPYPQLKPPVRGKYLIQLPDSGSKSGFYVDLLGWDGSESVEKTWDLMKVVAFIKVPDFYYPKEE